MYIYVYTFLTILLQDKVLNHKILNHKVLISYGCSKPLEHQGNMVPRGLGSLQLKQDLTNWVPDEKKTIWRARIRTTSLWLNQNKNC